MKIKFHHVLGFFLVTLFLDLDYSPGGVIIRPMDIFLVITLAIMLLNQKHFKIAINPATVSLYIFLIFIAFNGYTQVQYMSVTKEVVQLIEYVFLMHLVANATSTEAKRKTFLNILFWGSGAVACYSAIYHISRGVLSGYKDLDSPKHAFAYFALFSILKYFQVKEKKYLYIPVIMFALLLDLLSGERKGWAGLFMGVSIFLWLQLRYNQTTKNVKTVFSLVLIFLLGVLGVFVFLVSNTEFGYLNRQFSSAGDIWSHLTSSGGAFETRSDQERVFMFNYGIALFFKHPYWGIGIDQFKSYVTAVTHGVIAHDAHNFYMKILDEEGIGGFILFVIFNIILLSSLLKINRNKISPEIAFTARLLIALFVLGSVINFFLSSKALTWMYFLVPCGMAIGLKRELVKKESEMQANLLEDVEQPDVTNAGALDTMAFSLS